jgi:hypothetical protein
MHAVLLAVSLAAGADPEPAIVPEGTAPKLVFLKVSGGKVVRPTMGTVVKTEMREAVRVLGGRVVREMVPCSRTVSEIIGANYPIEGATFGLAGGGKIDAATFKKRLGGGATVIVSADGCPVHPGYLKAFKPSTLVLVPASSTRAR